MDVPIRVQVPPRIDAKAIGISSLEGLILALRESPMMGGKKTAVAVVLFMNAETLPTVVMTARISRFEVLPAIL